MRAFIISMILLVIIISGSLVFMYLIDKTANEIVSNLEELDAAVKDNDWENAEKQLNEIQEAWKSTEAWMTTLINHNEIDSIKMSLAKLSQYIHYKDTTEYMAESGVLKFLIQHISTRERLSLSNLL